MEDMNTPDLERDILENDLLKTRAKADRQFALDMYRALCNNVFIHSGGEEPVTFGCSWRYAGGIMAELVDGHDYMDFYCAGGEGDISPEIEQVFAELGWTVDPNGYKDY